MTQGTSGIDEGYKNRKYQIAEASMGEVAKELMRKLQTIFELYLKASEAG